MAQLSAGILAYHKGADGWYFFLVHPGGPFFKNKNKGWWSIPKGLTAENEAPVDAARREFKEETGIELNLDLIPLGEIRQKSGKTVLAWAAEMHLPDNWELECNMFEIEWPPRSGRLQKFPEVDDARFFTEKHALEYILPAQAVLIQRLLEHLA